MKKILTSALVAATLTTAASAKLVSFEYDTMPYFKAGGSAVSGVSNAFTLAFKVDKNLRAGIMQETVSINLSDSAAAAAGTGVINISSLNLEFNILEKASMDTIFGLNIGSATVPAAITNGTATETIAAGSYMASDLYVKSTYKSGKHASIGIKLGYRILPIADSAGAALFENLNGVFLKVGVETSF